MEILTLYRITRRSWLMVYSRPRKPFQYKRGMKGTIALELTRAVRDCRMRQRILEDMDGRDTVLHYDF